jgi:hypothetical protein
MRGLAEIAISFLKIGATAYGGPAIMGVMQAEFQEIAVRPQGGPVRGPVGTTTTRRRLEALLTHCSAPRHFGVRQGETT